MSFKANIKILKNGTCAECLSGNNNELFYITQVAPDKDPFCGICKKGPESNKRGQPEKLIHCSQCENSGMQ